MEHTREALLIHFDPLPPTTSSRHRSGGAVENPGRRRAPLCRNCRTALHVILELDLGCPELHVSIADLDRAVILTCLNCDGYSSPMFYRDLGPTMGIEVLSQGSGESYGDFPDKLSVRAVELSRRSPLGDPSKDERLHQIGGEPFWVAEAAAPQCATCHTEMEFLAQIDSDPRLGWKFGDAGLLYAFFCGPCRVFASFVQDDN